MSGVIRVVVADDEPDLRLLVRLQLGRVDGVEVVGEAADGAEAVDVAVAEAADVVVMDLLMPGTSGFDGIAALLADHPAIGVVAYTAVAGDFVRAEMARLDVELVLKSGDIAPLVAAIERTASRR
ncbi:response regulator [Euzebya sp.]|uniref:response regulator n=1 Tax=Euzebya sp. TaxID=1971409 RepID=UPI0035177DC9